MLGDGQEGQGPGRCVIVAHQIVLVIDTQYRGRITGLVHLRPLSLVVHETVKVAQGVLVVADDHTEIVDTGCNRPVGSGVVEIGVDAVLIEEAVVKESSLVFADDHTGLVDGEGSRALRSRKIQLGEDAVIVQEAVGRNEKKIVRTNIAGSAVTAHHLAGAIDTVGCRCHSTREVDRRGHPGPRIIGVSVGGEGIDAHGLLTEAAHRQPVGIDSSQIRTCAADWLGGDEPLSGLDVCG